MTTTNINVFKVRTENRVKLFYVDEISSEIKHLCDSNKHVLDEYDQDAIEALLERGATYSFENTNIVYVGEVSDPNLDFIFIENAANFTSAHVALLLRKYKNAQVILFLSTFDKQQYDEHNLRWKSSVIETNLNELNAEGLRTREKPIAHQFINASEALAKVVKQLESKVRHMD